MPHADPDGRCGPRRRRADPTDHEVVAVDPDHVTSERAVRIVAEVLERDDVEPAQVFLDLFRPTAPGSAPGRRTATWAPVVQLVAEDQVLVVESRG